MYKEITHNELQSLVLEGQPIELVDVREPWEWELIRIPQAKLIPQGELPSRIDEIDFSKPVYLFCRTGWRSGQACAWLETQGKTATNVSGSIRALYGDSSPILLVSDAFDPQYLA